MHLLTSYSNVVPPSISNWIASVSQYSPFGPGFIFLQAPYISRGMMNTLKLARWLGGCSGFSTNFTTLFPSIMSIPNLLGSFTSLHVNTPSDLCLRSLSKRSVSKSESQNMRKNFLSLINGSVHDTASAVPFISFCSTYCILTLNRDPSPK